MNLASQTSVTSENNGTTGQSAGGDSDGASASGGGGGGTPAATTMPSNPTPTPGTSTPQRSMGNFYGEQQYGGTPPSSAKFMTSSSAGMWIALWAKQKKNNEDEDELSGRKRILARTWTDKQRGSGEKFAHRGGGGTGQLLRQVENFIRWRIYLFWKLLSQQQIDQWQSDDVLSGHTTRTTRELETE